MGATAYLKILSAPRWSITTEFHSYGERIDEIGVKQGELERIKPKWIKRADEIWAESKEWFERKYPYFCRREENRLGWLPDTFSEEERTGRKKKFEKAPALFGSTGGMTEKDLEYYAREFWTAIRLSSKSPAWIFSWSDGGYLDSELGYMAEDWVSVEAFLIKYGRFVGSIPRVDDNRKEKLSSLIDTDREWVLYLPYYGIEEDICMNERLEEFMK